MLLRGNLRRGAALCLLLLALVHEATGQRRTGRRNNYKLHDDGVNGNSLYELSTCCWGRLVTPSCLCTKLLVGGSHRNMHSLRFVQSESESPHLQWSLSGWHEGGDRVTQQITSTDKWRITASIVKVRSLSFMSLVLGLTPSSSLKLRSFQAFLFAQN